MREFLSQRGKEERVGFQPRDRKKVSYVLRMEVFDLDLENLSSPE